jgi:tetratricopeptide (TPR) repeat protein
LPLQIQPKARALTRIHRSFLLTFLLALFSGCSVGTFMSAYFNTYYNAQKLFDEAEEEVNTQQRSAKPAVQPFLAPFDISSSTKTKFITVIEKCSKLLQYHPESSLVDDALLMIGKSYYYQDENQKAERKFNELLDGYPQSGLIFETKLLLAKVWYRMSEKQKAYSLARELSDAATKEGKDEIVAGSSLLLAQVELENKNFDLARTYYQIAAEKGETAEQRWSAFMKVAEAYIQQEKYGEAADAFRNAEQASTTYTASYRSQLGRARMLSKMGNQEQALRLLENLRYNQNNKEFFGQIDLEIANTYRDMNNFPVAITQYSYVDTTYARTEQAANGYYQLGLLYEKQLMNYDSARVAYNKGKSEFPSAEVTPLLVRRAETMNRYFAIRKELTRYDSIRALLVAPDLPVPVVKDSMRSDSAAAGKKPPDSVKVSVPVRPSISLDSVDVIQGRNKVELAGLFYVSLGVPDSAEYWYKKVLADHPGSIHAPRALYMLAQLYGRDSSSSRGKADSLYREILARYPRSEFTNEAEKVLGLPLTKGAADPATESYARAEQLLAGGQHDAALDTLREIVRAHAESPVAPKAQYAAGWIYEEVTLKPDSAIALYQRLVKLYPASQYAGLVRPKLAEVEFKQRAPVDSVKKDTSRASLPVIPANVVQPQPKLLPPEPRPQQRDSTGVDKPDTPLVKPESEVPERRRPR